MKKVKYLSLAIVAIMLLGLQSCDWIKGLTHAEDGSSPSDSVSAPQYCTVEFSDSVGVVNSHAYQSIKVDFPAEEDTSVVAQNVLAWLCEKVRSCCYPDWSGERLRSDSVAQVLETAGETFAEAYVKTYGQKGLKLMEEDIRTMAEEGFEGSYLNDLRIELSEQTDNYLTFITGYEVYTGGAHGGYLADGATFSKADGKRMGWNMFDPSKRAELVAQLKKGLMDYFNDAIEDKITTDSALFEMLILYDDPETPENELEYGIPLPQTEPYVTRKGIAFIYQQYEIAAYACGLPSCVLPVSAVAPCLSAEGKAFLGVH